MRARDEPSEGDFVLIKDEQQPAMKWEAGRIVSKHPGSDGKTRVVSIKTNSGKIKTRATTKVVLMPKAEEESPPVELEKQPVQLRRSKRKTGKVTMISTISLLLMMMASCSFPITQTMPVHQSRPYDIQQFKQPTPMLFKPEKSIFISTSHWTIVSYFDL